MHLGPYWKARSEFDRRQEQHPPSRQTSSGAKIAPDTRARKDPQRTSGIQRCRLRAHASVLWPGLSHELENMVKQCHKCARDHNPRKEPMIPTELPEYPWQKMGTDLFHWKGATYLVAVDYLSRYPEAQKLSNTTSSGIIAALKSIFSRLGIPETVSVIMVPNMPPENSRNLQTLLYLPSSHKQPSVCSE